MSNFYKMPVELRRVVMDLTLSCLTEKPDDYAEFCLMYFERLREQRASVGSRQRKEVSSDYLSTASVADYASLMKRRNSIRTEPFDPGDTESVVSAYYIKGPEEIEKLTEVVKNVVILKTLKEEDLLKVMQAMAPRLVQKGEVIIQQGSEEANFFYVVDEGVFEASVTYANGETNVVRTYDNSGSFGELALLYNMPRSATVTAVTDGKIWELNRRSFRKIVLKAAHDKRERYKDLMEQVEFLREIGAYQTLDVADSLIEKQFSGGDVIFKQGDEADGMYFIEAGTVDCIVEYNGKERVSVKILGPGAYFGELALVTHNRRALTAQALEDVKLAFLDKATFERLLGPCQEVFEKNFKNYEDEMIKAVGTSAPVLFGF